MIAGQGDDELKIERFAADAADSTYKDAAKISLGDEEVSINEGTGRTPDS